MQTAFLFTVLTIAVPDRPDLSPKTEKPLPDQLLGRWKLTKRVNSGNVDLNVSDLQMVFARAEMMQHLGNSKSVNTYPYRLDVGKIPAQIDFYKANSQGILRIEGDVLVIVLDNAGPGRFPAQFESLPGSTTTLLQLTRVRD